MRLVIPLVLALASGCSYYATGVKSEEINKLSLGMTKEQVLSTLGQPARTEADEATEILYYLLTNDSSYATTVMTVGMLPPITEKSEYSVVFKQGRVTSFGSRK